MSIALLYELFHTYGEYIHQFEDEDIEMGSYQQRCINPTDEQVFEFLEELIMRGNTSMVEVVTKICTEFLLDDKTGREFLVKWNNTYRGRTNS